MKFVLIYISIFSLLFSNISFKPVVFIDYLSSGSDYQYLDSEIKIFGAGIESVYILGDLSINAKFINHRLFSNLVSSNKIHSFNHHQGFSWSQDPTSSGNSFDYDFADLNIKYTLDSGTIYLGKMNPEWGEGKSKLIFSNKSPSFPLFGFDWRLNPYLKMEYLHGHLMSGIPDYSTLEDYYSNKWSNSKGLNVSRNIAAHRFIWTPFEKLSIIGTETVVYGVRGIDIHYLVPFIPFWSLQHYLGDTDNIQMALEMKYSFTEKLKTYGTIFIDEWSPDKTFDDYNRNWFGYQAGLKYSSLLNMSDQLILEFSWTDSRIYKHRFNLNDYYSHNYPLGFWAGPHAEEFFLSYGVNVFDIDWLTNLSIAKRGRSVELFEQYSTNIENNERYSGSFEEKLFLNFQGSKLLYKYISIIVGISYIDWKNGGFIPSLNDSEQTLNDVEKISFNLRFGINY